MLIPPPSPSKSLPWIELPADITANILRRLNVEEILESAQRVCTAWWRVCKDPSMWRVIHMEPSGPFFDIPTSRKLEMMCHEAVDRSQGQLIDITIECFGTNELILYISRSCSNLKCLKLVYGGLSSRCLGEAVQNFRELEELHLIFHDILPKEIQNIGTSCLDGIALAVAKSMPNLHHLCLLGHRMTNKGLEAILDSCPHLESLDIRRCFDIYLPENLRKRISEQMTYLKLPNDPIDDPHWASDDFDYFYDSGYDTAYGRNFDDLGGYSSGDPDNYF
ncbi:putative F-box/LRR-repeat protein 23 [Andrographis paniculata]|uniref:putative F-box/LRR-repeat protein 23 n=1 Tax=Andrographis paniculata TaxID=175694 RepID=UPI0021E9741C|nr:putative F-box/LRR-repeat protein 23 [Andrographis paniculata]